VTLDRDLIEVRVTWRHIGASPFVANQSHIQVARMVIVGKPEITPSRPRLMTLEMLDANTNGRVDKVVATFDQPLEAACNTGWNLANTPSGGTLLTVTIDGTRTTATLTITEGPQPPDTAVGNFRVTFEPAASCSAEGFSNRPPTDKARPVPVDISTTAGGVTPGKMESGDELTITFSEPVVGVPLAPTVTEQDIPGQGNDRINISGITNAERDTGSDNYITRNNRSASFNANVTVSGSVIRVRLTGSCSGDCGDLGAGQGAFNFAPSATIKDAASNSAAGSFTTSSSFRIF
jgi:hypothetical protein